MNPDNGPENHRRRTPVVKRRIDVGRRYGRSLQLASSPPYHRKYNAIERCWGARENPWNGTLLDGVDPPRRFAETMTWNGKHPLVQRITKSYQEGGDV